MPVVEPTAIPPSLNPTKTPFGVDVSPDPYQRYQPETEEWVELETPTPEPTATPEAEEVKAGRVELRNCTTNAPEVLEAGIEWAINQASEEKGGPFELIVNEAEEAGIWKPGTMLITEDIEVIIRVVGVESSLAYLKFSSVNRFGYYNEDGRLLIVVRGSPPRALFRALLGLQLDDEHHRLGPHDSPGIGHQIPLGAWETINYQPLADSWKSAGVDDILLSEDSFSVGEG